MRKNNVSYPLSGAGKAWFLGKQAALRLCHIGIVLLGITFLSFSLLHMAPGDPAEKYLTGGDGNVGLISEEAIQAQREKWGLDKPFLVQYVTWLGNALRGDLGESFATGNPVVTELWDKIGPTVILALASLFVTLLVSIPLGVLCAVYKDRLLDNICRVVSFVGISVPSFLSSLLLLYFFAMKLQWFPVISRGGIQGLVLPVAVLAFQCSAKFTRQVRAVVLEQLHQEYVRGAVARGVKKSRILFDHVLRNAWLPIVTWLGSILACSWAARRGGNGVFLAGDRAARCGIGSQQRLPDDPGDCALDGGAVSCRQFPGGYFLHLFGSTGPLGKAG